MSTTAYPEVRVDNSNHQYSSFLNLPFEVRTLVYQHLFSKGSVTLFRDTTSTNTHNNSDVPQHPTPLIAILLTSKQCYQEATTIFYREVTFQLQQGLRFSLTGPTHAEVIAKFGANSQHVSHVYYHGSDPKVIFQIGTLFPKLKRLEMSLGEDFFHSDQTNFDRAMRYALRYGEWKVAVKHALDERFGPGMRDAVARLRQLGPARGFGVVLHWGMAYRFVDFVGEGEIDLDEGILRIRDPNGSSKKVYEIPQNPLEPTWCEGRLTLPSVPSTAEGPQ